MNNYQNFLVYGTRAIYAWLLAGNYSLFSLVSATSYSWVCLYKNCLFGHYWNSTCEGWLVDTSFHSPFQKYLYIIRSRVYMCRGKHKIGGILYTVMRVLKS